MARAHSTVKGEKFPEMNFIDTEKLLAYTPQPPRLVGNDVRKLFRPEQFPPREPRRPARGAEDAIQIVRARLREGRQTRRRPLRQPRSQLPVATPRSQQWPGNPDQQPQGKHRPSVHPPLPFRRPLSPPQRPRTQQTLAT